MSANLPYRLIETRPPGDRATSIRNIKVPFLHEHIEDLVFCHPGSTVTAGVAEIKTQSNWLDQSTSTAGSLLCDLTQSLEYYLRIREATESHVILVAACLAGLNSLVLHRTMESFDLSATARLLSLLRTHPDSPFLVLELASKVFSLESVEKVAYERTDEGLRVWTIANNASEAQRYAIYDKQWEAMQDNSNLLVDFQLLDRRDRPLDQLAAFSGNVSIILR